MWHSYERSIESTVRMTGMVPHRRQSDSAARYDKRLADANKEVLKIKGTATIGADLLADIDANENARYFRFEEYPMYTKRESELLQQYMQEHSQMPGGGADELDDLF